MVETGFEYAADVSRFGIGEKCYAVQDVGAVLFVDVLDKAKAEAALLFEAQFYREVVAAF
mgnify:CR=1 FL=1